MARGFDSKSVGEQQAEAQNPRAPGEAPENNAALLLRRRRLELSRADVLRRMQVATAEVHREMLRRALEALEKELAGMA